MSVLDCSHDSQAPKKACHHLFKTQDAEFVKFFNGVGKEYYLTCYPCSKAPEDFNSLLITVCEKCFNQIERDGYWEGIVGKPKTTYQKTGLSFTNHIEKIPSIPSGDIVAIQPLHGSSTSKWIGLTRNGNLVTIDFGNSSLSTILEISPLEIDFTKSVSLYVSHNGKFAVIANTMGTTSLVIDINSSKQTLRLDRDGYHSDVSPYSVNFFMNAEKIFLAHQTSWNRLDIFDPETGELLTPREPTSYRQGESRPEHYLDYFHGRLLISPDQTWIADDGWVWHPVGRISTWNIQKWLTENSWESEDGQSKKYLCQRNYFWGGPMCWVNNHTLAVWGYGLDDEWLLPAVRIFDVITGDEIDWFPGVEIALEDDKKWPDNLTYWSKSLIYDKYLFASSEKFGVSVWDMETGSCLLRDSSFSYIAYHYETQEFLSLLSNGTFQLSRLIEK